MAQPADFSVANASGADVRTDLNNIFDAISINNGFGSVPTTKYKYMWYADTSTDKMSFYKANATDKLDFISLSDGSFFGPNGSLSNPSYTFTNSTNTGFYRSSANEIGVSCNAYNTATFKQSQVDIAGDLLIQNVAGQESELRIVATGSSDNSSIDLVADSTYTEFGLKITRNDGANGDSQITHRGTGDFKLFVNEAAPMIFSTTSTERCRIDASGNFLVGTTLAGSPGGISMLPLNSNGSGTIIFDRSNSTDTSVALSFENSNTGVGFISYTNSATVYSTSSDYRLKENAVSISDGITRLKTLKPYTFNFKVNPDTKVDGFFAHEVTAVPEAVTGTKDEVDSDNNPVYQGIDHSKLVPLLTAALQEAIAKIEVLETKVAALEAG
tara:strand:- start:297 stop:1451 length:1155 start_codon:yes stop_codon:yes gene_type:complete